MQRIEMHLNDESFEMVKSGKKTMEMRIYDEKRQKIDMGDEIVFINKETKILVKITRLFVASSFEILFNKIGGIKAGWKKNDNVAKMAKDMRKIYSTDEENKWGVVGIEFEVLV
ncbi:MAG: ASCH domain-containing protein [Candidatus Shapirobacteria bacterium]